MKKHLVIATIAIFLLFSTVSAIRETVVLKDYVVDFEYKESDLKAGETFKLTATITNEAGEARSDIEMSLDLEEPFDSVGEDSRKIGVLNDGESKTISFRLKLEDDAKSGDYTIDFEIKDNKKKDSDELSVEVKSNRIELIIGNVESQPKLISPDLEDIKLKITLQNTEDKDAEFVRVKLILPEGFSPSGSYSDSANLGTVGAKQSKDVEFFIDTAQKLKSGRHPAYLEVTYIENGKTKNERLDFDLQVKGRPQFKITEISTNPAKLSRQMKGELRLKIENFGGEEGKETSIRVFENSDQPFSFDQKTNFIGDLPPKGSGTASLKFKIDNDAVEKTYLVRLQLRTVSNGNVLVDEINIPIEVSAVQRNNTTYWMIGFSITLLGVLVFFVFRLIR